MKYLVTNPLNYFFALLILSFLIYFFTKLKWYWKVLPLAGLFVASIILTPMGANALSGLIVEDSPPTDCDTDVAIVVADGWSQIPNSNSDFGVLHASTLRQIDNAKHWLMQRETRKLIISAPSSDRAINQNALMNNYALASGIAAKQLIVSRSDGSPANAATLASQAVESREITVIDSEIKTLRNALAFEKQGFTVCNVVSEKNEISAHILRMITPSAESVALSQQTLWETAGLAWYWWEGKI